MAFYMYLDGEYVFAAYDPKRKAFVFPTITIKS